MSRNSSAEPKFYGRRKGKTLRAGRQNALEEVYPRIRIDLPFSMTALFPSVAREVWLEIGFGDGEHLLYQAMQNPDVGLIGCEPFINGIAALCKGIAESNVQNIRIFGDDARLFVEHDGGLDGPRGEAMRTLLYLFDRDAAARLLRSG